MVDAVLVIIIVLALLFDFVNGFHDKTSVVVSHRLSTVKMADRILVLSEGRLVESGNHDELVRAGGIYSGLFALHSRQ